MSINNLSFYPRIVFLLSTIIIIISRILGMEFIALIFTPFLTLSLIYDYHITVGKDQAPYFIYSFCLLGDLIVLSDDFYYFTSALMAYWGASIIYCLILSRELEKPLVELMNQWKYILPFGLYIIYFFLIMAFLKPYLKELFIPIIIYSATITFAAPLGLIVYLNKASKPLGYFVAGMVLLSITASVIGLNRFYFKSNLLNGIETLLYTSTLYLIFLYFKTKTNHEF